MSAEANKENCEDETLENCDTGTGVNWCHAASKRSE